MNRAAGVAPSDERSVGDAPRGIAARILAAWDSPWTGSYWLGFAAAAVLAGACLARAYAGAEGFRLCTQDLFVVLDGGWRMLHGQHPNVDFYNELGPCLYGMMAVALWLSHASAAAFGWVQGFAGAALGLWAWALARRRLDPLPRLLFCAAIVLMAISPYVYGYSVLHTSPAMVYNHLGYSLVALAMLEASLDRRPATARSEAAGGFSTGLAAGIALFLKITYFAWMFPLAALLLRCRPQTRARWLGIATGLAAGCAPFVLYYRGNFAPMLHDLWITSGAKHIQWRWDAVEAFYLNVAPMTVFVLLALGALRAGEARGRAVLQAALIGVATIAGGYLLLLTNTQANQMPLNAIGAMLILQLLAGRPRQSAPSWPRALAIAWGVWFAVAAICLDGAGVAWAGLTRRHFAHDTWNQLTPARLAGISSLEHTYVELVNDGFVLLDRYRQPGETVMSMDFSNPFSIGLGIPPAHGGTADLHFGTNYDDRHHPSAEWIFGDANLVLDPIVPTDRPAEKNVQRVFGPYVYSHYHQIAESSRWRLYRRNRP